VLYVGKVGRAGRWGGSAYSQRIWWMLAEWAGCAGCKLKAPRLAQRQRQRWMLAEWAGCAGCKLKAPRLAQRQRQRWMLAEWAGCAGCKLKAPRLAQRQRQLVVLGGEGGQRTWHPGRFHRQDLPPTVPVHVGASDTSLRHPTRGSCGRGSCLSATQAAAATAGLRVACTTPAP